MSKKIAAVLGAVGVGALVVVLLRRKARVRGQRPQPGALDLNRCSEGELLVLGLQGEHVARVIENRPYRNRLDLVSRMVLPLEVFELIKYRVDVPTEQAKQPVQVA